jgi:hypothetical protein
MQRDRIKLVLFLVSDGEAISLLRLCCAVCL